MTFFIDDWINELVSKIKKEYGDNVILLVYREVTNVKKLVITVI